VLVAAAWTAPAVMGLSAAPAFAGSGDVVAGTLTSATWRLLSGALSTSAGQAGRTGWTTEPNGIYEDDGTATESTLLGDLGATGAGFLSEQDAGSETTTIQVDFHYSVTAGTTVLTQFEFRSDHDESCEPQLLDIVILGDNDPVSFGYTTGVPDPMSDRHEFSEDGLTGAGRFIKPNSTSMTVCFTFTIPGSAPTDNLWVKRPEIAKS
jgi:hypothetical protein